MPFLSFSVFVFALLDMIPTMKFKVASIKVIVLAQYLTMVIKLLSFCRNEVLKYDHSGESY